jgi:formylglycine-generating enzyme required for sulfatase activity
MVPISGGSFLMGSSDSGASSEQPVHEVTLSAFYMDTTEVTQGSYTSLMGVNPSSHSGDARLPVEGVTWYDAVLYCNARSRQEGRDTVYSFTSISGIPGNGSDGLGNLSINYAKDGYRLPTEAEWEYACRAGTTTDYYWGKNYPPATAADTASIDSNAIWSHNSGDSTAEVRTRLPNAWGLYDMVGNVQEWCNDWYVAYSPGAQTNPEGPAVPPSQAYNVLRGGSFLSHADAMSSANRADSDPTNNSGGIGFRCVARR